MQNICGTYFWSEVVCNLKDILKISSFTIDTLYYVYFKCTVCHTTVMERRTDLCCDYVKCHRCTSEYCSEDCRASLLDTIADTISYQSLHEKLEEGFDCVWIRYILVFHVVQGDDIGVIVFHRKTPQVVGDASFALLKMMDCQCKIKDCKREINEFFDNIVSNMDI